MVSPLVIILLNEQEHYTYKIDQSYSNYKIIYYNSSNLAVIYDQIKQLKAKYYTYFHHDFYYNYHYLKLLISNINDDISSIFINEGYIYITNDILDNHIFGYINDTYITKNQKLMNTKFKYISLFNINTLLKLHQNDQKLIKYHDKDGILLQIYHSYSISNTNQYITLYQNHSNIISFPKK